MSHPTAIELQPYKNKERYEFRETKFSWADKIAKWLPANVPETKRAEYASTLIDNEIYSVETLAKLEGRDLAEMKIPTGHRALILDGARREAEEAPTQTTYYSICGNLGFQCRGMWQELLSARLWQSFIGEFLASAVYVFILNSIIVSSGTLVGVGGKTAPGPLAGSLALANLDPARYLAIAIGAGFAFALAVYTFSPMFAGHVTPAITWAYLFTAAVSPLKWILFLIAQLAGAMVATGFVNTISFNAFNSAEGGRNIVQPGYRNGTSVGIEVLTTFILILTALAYNDRGRTRGGRGFAPIALGFVVLTVHLISLPINGTSLNPARSFASSAVYHEWDAHWTYWLGPALGSLIAVLVYELFLREKSVPNLFINDPYIRHGHHGKGHDQGHDHGHGSGHDHGHGSGHGSGHDHGHEEYKDQ